MKRGVLQKNVYRLAIVGIAIGSFMCGVGIIDTLADSSNNLFEIKGLIAIAGVVIAAASLWYIAQLEKRTTKK